MKIEGRGSDELKTMASRYDADVLQPMDIFILSESQWKELNSCDQDRGKFRQLELKMQCSITGSLERMMNLTHFRFLGRPLNC